ncbi:CueP family metal-binding protein [Mobilicoccus caccae]|uniref:Lipoprotein n=1 Tax=Mobilicoccus caccae TaxID=1859295 RepID=A0ABQ6IXM4_9MICO|nr:CueP family metal-binding protein [Mobilicoccus caccae]GMA42326.1 hypothetical protein GCM10025883_43710 [Mobilicoccus caccae]
MKTRVLPLALAVALSLAACGSGGETQAGSPAPQGAATSQHGGGSGATGGAGGEVIDTVKTETAAAPKVENAMLEKYGISGRSVVELVDFMDETNEHRGSGLNGSVRADHLLLKDEQTGQEQAVPVPDGLFYVSVAPYAGRTHECFNHSLTGCVGEFAGTQMQAKVVTDDGTVLHDGPVTTFENGFVGFWLPRDVKGTMSFTYDGKSVEAPFATDEKSPTCITTMQLT